MKKIVGEWVDAMNSYNQKETMDTDSTAEKVDIWLTLLLSTFTFFLGVSVYSLFINDLGMEEIYGLFAASGAVLAGIVSFIGSRQNTQKTIEIQKKMSNDNNKIQKELHQSKIDADLKATARIDWIQKVREASSSFLSSALKLKGLTNERVGERNPLQARKLDDKIIDELNFFQEKRLILMLYFGTNTQNNKIVDDIEDINACLSIFIEDQQTGGLSQVSYEYYMEEIKNRVEAFNESMRKYLKIEWDRAKNGE